MLDVHTEIRTIADKYLERVRPSGADNIMALCPFHDDSTASFAMNVNNGVYFCHACHARGNLYSFLKGVGVSRAVIEVQYRYLIDEARKCIPASPDPTNPGVYDVKTIPDGILGNFDGYRLDSLISTGFHEKTIQHFDIGYDRWHGRITYPIRDILGNLVGISGRTIYPDVKPKYKLYDKEYTLWGISERGGWDRRKILYNMNNVLPVVRTHPSHNTFLVVVEGFKACMWVWQAGIRNVVAILGSYFSWEHRWLVEQFSGKVYFFLDNNTAGKVGTYDACRALLLPPKARWGEASTHTGSTIAPYIIEYPSRLIDDVKAQPDNLTSEEVWEQLFSAVPYTTWLRRQMGNHPTSV